MAVSWLIKLLKSSSMHNRRAAALALGRIGEKVAVPALLAAAALPLDRALEHSITYALIEIADPIATAAGLKDTDARIVDVALVALDQMDGGRPDPALVAGLLSSTDSKLKETASWVAGRHPEWAGALASVLGKRLDQPDLSAADRTELEKQLGKLAQAAPSRISWPPACETPPPRVQRRASSLQAMAWSGLSEKQVPPAWISGPD